MDRSIQISCQRCGACGSPAWDLYAHLGDHRGPVPSDESTIPPGRGVSSFYDLGGPQLVPLLGMTIRIPIASDFVIVWDHSCSNTISVLPRQLSTELFIFRFAPKSAAATSRPCSRKQLQTAGTA